MVAAAANAVFGYSAPVHLRDVDDLKHAVSGSDLELVQLQPGRLDVLLAQASVGDASIDVGVCSAPLRVKGGLDARRFTVKVFHPGARATWNGHHVDASRLLFFMPGRELNGHLSAGYGWTSVVIPPNWLASIAQTQWHASMLELGTACRMLRPNAEVLADLCRATENLVTLGTIPMTLPAAGWLTSDLRNALGAALSALDSPPIKVMSRALAHFSIAHRAERYMRERIAEPICIDDLCAAMHASRRYLEYAFADAVGASPSRYLRLMRLHQVRHRLKFPRDETNVTNEAVRLGFNHLSLFSVQYKQAFGESPSATLARGTRPAVRRRLPPRSASMRIVDSEQAATDSRIGRMLQTQAGGCPPLPKPHSKRVRRTISN